MNFLERRLWSCLSNINGSLYNSRCEVIFLQLFVFQWVSIFLKILCDVFNDTEKMELYSVNFE